MKQIVKTADGELTYGSMAEVKNLYQQGFITADDLIRAETSEKWVRCGNVPVLAAAETRGKTETAMGLRVTLAIGLSIVLAGAVQRERWLFIGGLVFMGVVTALYVYQKS